MLEIEHNHIPYVIGIAGSSGSGKTYFLRNFLNHYPAEKITLISQDDYYIPANTKTREENRIYNFDLPTAIDRNSFFKDIQSLFNGQTIYKKEYTFNNPDVIPKTLKIEPAPILIVEGLFIYYYEEINNLLDYKIFLNAPEEIALQRRLKRDRIERGYNHEDVMYKWIHHVTPSYKQYLLPYKNKCDLIIENNLDDPMIIEKAIKQVAATVETKGIY